MKRYLPSLLAALFLITAQMKGQVTHTIQYQVSPASCATCCDGSFTLNITNCWNYIIQSTPTLSLLSYTGITKSYTNVCSGTYTIYTIGSDLCGPSITDYFTMPFGTGQLEFNREKPNIKVFPNPANSFVHFKTDIPINEKLKLRISDITGRQLEELNLDTPLTTLNIANYEEGIYFADCIYKERVIEKRKFIVVK